MPNIQPATASSTNTNIPRPLSKRATAIMIMKAHSELQMPKVVELIARANQLTLSAARAYYRWIVINEMAPGKIVEHIRAPRSPNKPKMAEMVAETAEPTVEQVAPQRKTRTRAENRAKLEAIAANKARRLKRAS